LSRKRRSGAPIVDDTGDGPKPSDRATYDPRIALDLIVASRTNPRALTFDQAKLQELATSIASIGVMQPILVRPLPAERLAGNQAGARKDKRPVYEIVSGERRWRASQLAGARGIPRCAAMTDDQVLEAQLVENLQRDDLHPLEEAEGYQRLCEATGIKKEDIAGRSARAAATSTTGSSCSRSRRRASRPSAPASSTPAAPSCSPRSRTRSCS
jgi:ParB/RepB/Spo0J family partition protein